MPYKHLGLLSVIILSIGLLFVIYKWPLSKHQTFSQHVAQRRSSILYYIALFGITLPPFVLFFVGWFTPNFGIAPLANVFVVLSAIFQIACTLVPETGGRKTQWHRALAGLSALCLVPVLMFVAANHNVSGLPRAATFTSLGIMGYCIRLVALARGEPRNFLLVQCAYFAAFFVPILLISYLV